MGKKSQTALEYHPSFIYIRAMMHHIYSSKSLILDLTLKIPSGIIFEAFDQLATSAAVK